MIASLDGAALPLSGSGNTVFFSRFRQLSGGFVVWIVVVLMLPLARRHGRPCRARPPAAPAAEPRRCCGWRCGPRRGCSRWCSSTSPTCLTLLPGDLGGVIARRGREPRAALPARGPDPAVPGARLPLRDGDRAPSGAALPRRHAGGRRRRAPRAPRRGARHAAHQPVLAGPHRAGRSCSGHWPAQAPGCVRGCRCGGACRDRGRARVSFGERLHLGWGVWWYFFLLLETRAIPVVAVVVAIVLVASAALLGHELHSPRWSAAAANAAAAAAHDAAQPASARRGTGAPGRDRRPTRNGRATSRRPARSRSSTSQAYARGAVGISSRRARATRRGSRRSRGRRARRRCAAPACRRSRGPAGRPRHSSSRRTPWP